MLWDSHLKKPALVADIVVRPRQHPARRRSHSPAVGRLGSVFAVVIFFEGADEGGVDGHVREELANLGGQRLLLNEDLIVNI